VPKDAGQGRTLYVAQGACHQLLRVPRQRPATGRGGGAEPLAEGRVGCGVQELALVGHPGGERGAEGLAHAPQEHEHRPVGGGDGQEGHGEVEEEHLELQLHPPPHSEVDVPEAHVVLLSAAELRAEKLGADERQYAQKAIRPGSAEGEFRTVDARHRRPDSAQTRLAQAPAEFVTAGAR